MNDKASLHVPRDALAGATLVVTRPSGDAGSIARRAAARGADVVRVPGLSLRAIDGGASLPRGVRFDDWIFTSPAAVRFGGAPLARIHRPARVFALGDGTRRALRRLGLDAIVPPDRHDSEGLLALPDLRAMRGRRVAIVGAPGGRDLIAPALRRRGADVEPIHVYRREPPRLTRRHADALAAARGPLALLVSSGEALSNLVALLPADAIARLRASLVVVSSERLAELARAHRFARIVVARSAAPDDLVGAAASALVRRRR
jgi:uroporphyrinogen-III synthase